MTHRWSHPAARFSSPVPERLARLGRGARLDPELRRPLVERGHEAAGYDQRGTQVRRAGDGAGVAWTRHPARFRRWCSGPRTAARRRHRGRAAAGCAPRRRRGRWPARTPHRRARRAPSAPGCWRSPRRWTNGLAPTEPHAAGGAERHVLPRRGDEGTPRVAQRARGRRAGPRPRDRRCGRPGPPPRPPAPPCPECAPRGAPPRGRRSGPPPPASPP